MSFIQNRADKYGGAIYYDIYRPKLTNITFEKNAAPYGPDIASYPVKVVVLGSNTSAIMLNDVASGQIYPETIKLSVVDFDNQIATDIVSGTISINSVTGDASTLGRSSEGIVKGVAVFEEIIFVSKPGSKNVTFSVSTNSIQRSKLLKQFGKWHL